MIQSLPRHIYCWVDSAMLYKQPNGFVPCVWFGLVGRPGRSWGLNVMLEGGQVYRNIPPHGVAFKPSAPKWRLSQAAEWDCYGEEFQLHEYTYLADLRCWVLYPKGNQRRGRYLFTIHPMGDGFSAEPEQAKEFKVVELDNGRLTIVPTNRILFDDASFTQPDCVRLITQTTKWRNE